MIAAVVSIVAAMALPAQTGRQRAGDADMRAVKTAEANRTMQLFSDCIVGRAGGTSKAVDAFLRLPSNDPRAFAAGVVLARGDCMPRSFLRTEMRLQSPLLRAALYDARYRREFARRPIDIANVAPLTVAGEFDGEPGAIEVAGRVFSDCIARKDAAATRALVLSRSGANAEDAAIAALRPAIAGCLSINDTMRLSRPMLRGVVGEALYKLSLAAAAPAARVAGTKN